MCVPNLPKTSQTKERQMRDFVEDEYGAIFTRQTSWRTGKTILKRVTHWPVKLLRVLEPTKEERNGTWITSRSFTPEKIYHVELAWTDRSGAWVSVIVDRGVMCDARRLCRLRAHGLPVAPGMTGKLVAYLSHTEFSDEKIPRVRETPADVGVVRALDGAP